MGPRGPRVLLPALLLLQACGPGETGEGARTSSAEATHPVVLVDDRGDTLTLPGPATRILSLVPSVTQTLARMGAADRLVGRTDYDTVTAVQDLPTVGGGLGPNLELLRTLDPQVVVAFAGESDVRTSQGLASLGIPEFAVRPTGLEDIPSITLRVGSLVGRAEAARALVDTLETELAAVRSAVAGRPRVPAVYLLGGSPPLAAGPGTFLADLLAVAGGTNVLEDLTSLYAPVSPEVLRARTVEVILTGEGTTLDPRITRDRRVVELPGWVESPGPSVGEAAWIVARALHPELGGGR